MLGQIGPGRRIIDDLLTRGRLDEATTEIVKLLWKPEYTIADLVRDTAAARLLAGQRGELLDVLLAAAVKQTSLIYESAIEDMTHGFCELTADGIILFANAALEVLLPDCVGRQLAAYVPRHQGEIREALTGRANVRSCRLQLETSRGTRSVLAQFGTIRSGATAFAIIVDLTVDEEAERRTFDTAPFPILKLDGHQRIAYANERASALLRLKPEEMIGLEPESLVRGPRDRERLSEELEKRRRGETSEYQVDLRPAEALPAERVIVRSIPQTDSDGNLAGTFVTLSTLTAEQVGQRIWDAACAATDPRELFASILEHLRGLIPFDKAILSLYTPERVFSRFLYEWPQSEVDALWFQIPRAFRDLADGPQPFGSIDETLGLEGGDELARVSVVADLKRQGMEAWIALPVYDPEQDAVFSLLHKGKIRYNESTQRIMVQSGLRRAMQTVLHLRRVREREFLLGLVRAIAKAKNDRELARLIVCELASFYGWQNVSVFKVSTIQRRFELLDQAAAAHNGFLLPEGYCQDIQTGFLGKAYGERAIQIVADGSKSPDKEVFVRGSVDTCSEMCVPVALQGQILWILNLEDRRPDAFREPDRRAVEGLMSQIEASLERSLGAALLNEVIDGVPEGVVITDTEGRMLSGNLAARDMLAGEANGAKLVDFFAEGSEEAKAAIGQQTSYPVEGTLVGLDGNETRVLVRSSIPRVEYDRRVVFLQDADKLTWHAETRQLMEILRSVAAQVRVPLSFASSLVRQIGRVGKDQSPRVIELVSRAIQHLSRVELTYDLVIDEATRTSEPALVRVQDVLTDAKSQLPAELRDRIRIHDEIDPTVRTDRTRFAGAVSAMLAYMLRIGGPSEIEIRLRVYGDAVGISMSKPASTEPPLETGTLSSDPIDEALARFALDEPGLHKFALSQRGLFRRRRTAGGESLRLVLRTE
jgi:PAS domain-containing protein